MSTVKATHFEHPSASTAGITLAADGSVVLPQGFTGGLGTNVVSVTKNDAFSTTSTAVVDVTGLTVTITPSTATSKVLLICSVAVGASDPANGPFGLLTTGANAAVMPVASGTHFDFIMLDAGTTSSINRVSIVGLISPASASAQTYKLRIRAGAGTGYVNRSGTGGAFATSTLTAIEVAV